MSKSSCPILNSESTWKSLNTILHKWSQISKPIGGISLLDHLLKSRF